MGTLIKFELRKILGNKAGMAACVLAFALCMALVVGNLCTAVQRDVETSEVAQGFEAQQVFKRMALSHAGVLDDERVAADAAALDRANELASQVEGFADMDSQQIIDALGLEFWQQTRGVLNQQYYMELVGTLDAADPRATSLQDGAWARIQVNLNSDASEFTDAEKDYWNAKAAEVSWPLEYGYAGAWDNALAYANFAALCIVALCIALSGMFAGEYQAGTAAIVLPTRRGKRALPAAKVAAAFIFTTAYWWLCSLIAIAINVAVCGPEGLGLPAQVVFNFANPYALMVGQAMLLVYGLGYLVALGMAAFTLALSALMRSPMPVAVIPMAISFLGLMGLFVGWRPLAKLAMLTPISGLNYAFGRMISYAVGPLVADLPTVLAILYAAMVVAFVPLAMRAFRRHQVA